MVRHPFAGKILPGKVAEFRRALGKSWEDWKSALRNCGAYNFSLWNAADLVFGYFETEEELTEEDLAELKKIEEYFAGTFSWISAPYGKMRLMYQDYGVYRESKELIRHRVFMTKLVPGSEEEYKARHDALVEAREGITQGPDSNFTIWNAGGYIFGYDEIDTTMEVEYTEEMRQGDIAWESRMLEIMEWITNDVDWLTGLYHRNVIRLAHFD